MRNTSVMTGNPVTKERCFVPKHGKADRKWQLDASWVPLCIKETATSFSDTKIFVFTYETVSFLV